MSSFKQQHTLNSFPQSQRTEQNQHFSFQKRNFSSSIEWLTSSKTTNWGAVFLILGVGGVIANELWKKRALAAEVKKEHKGSDATNSELDRNVQLKEFSREEVSKHKTKETGIWVTFGNEVYDITKFVDEHPGGDKIMMAAGGAIDPYWSIYAVHKHQNVMEMLEKMKIGVLRAEDRVDLSKVAVDANDPYANDPVRNPILKINNQKPFNAETPPLLLTDNFITPTELFFIRNHLPVPKIDPKSYRLVIQGDDVPPVSLTLDELKTKFPQHTVVATIQCAGNRRTEMNKENKPVKGLAWTQGAISTAEWKGVKLSDVLKYAGIQSDESKYKHIQLEGLDKDPTGQIYGASIPSYKAFDPTQDVLLAFEMNGQELPIDHGYPIRLVAPGIVGARNVKWLCKIVASKNESDSFWQQKDYKSFNSSVNWSNVDFSTAPAIQESPIQSAITEPIPGAKLPNIGQIHVEGYAYSGGGRGIIRVDISIDGGQTWQVAQLKNPSGQPSHRAWAWTLWEATIPVPENAKKLQILCKATDLSYNSQPESVDSIWNLRGVLNNSWHHVEVELD